MPTLTSTSNKSKDSTKDTVESSSQQQQQPSADDIMINKLAAKKKKDDEKEIARKKKRALQARERRARKKKEKEEEEARKNTKINEQDDDGNNNGEPPKKKKKMSNNNNDNTTKNTDGHSPKPEKDTLDEHKKKVLVEEAVGRAQSIKVRLKLPTTPTQKFGFSLRDDVQGYGLPVLAALSPDSPYINSIPFNVINNCWITKLSLLGEEGVDIYSSNMLVEELGKMRSASGNNKNDDNDKSWIDVTFTARSIVTQKKSVSPKKKETTPVVKLKPASPMMKKKNSESETKKKATTPVKEKKKSPNSIATKKSPSATNVTVAERKQLDQVTHVNTIKAAARFRLAQAELALEFASAQLRSAMNELEDARAEVNRAENGSIIMTAPQQQGKTTG